jgi:hypothetical protein
MSLPTALSTTIGKAQILGSENAKNIINEVAQNFIITFRSF